MVSVQLGRCWLNGGRELGSQLEKGARKKRGPTRNGSVEVSKRDDHTQSDGSFVRPFDVVRNYGDSVGNEGVNS